MAEKRDNVREKGESTLTSTRAARRESLDFYHLGRLTKGMKTRFYAHFNAVNEASMIPIRLLKRPLQFFSTIILNQ